MAIDIVARALAVSGKQNLENYYTKTESDNRYVLQSSKVNTVYTVNSSGAQTNQPLASAATANTIPIRNASGQLNATDPTDALNVVNKQYGEGNYYQLTEGTAVSSSDTIDLNTYKTAGTYNLPSSPKTNTPPDVGSATPGKLIVEYLYDNDHIIQSFYSLSNVGSQYQRVFDAMWSDWVKIATTSYVDNKTAVLIDNSLLGA